MLEVRLLGQFDVQAEGKRVLIQRRAGQSLFAFLILTAGTTHRRERIAGLFWPDVPDEAARRNLRQELWRVRKAFSSSPAIGDYFVAEEFSLSFNRKAEYWLDVAQLEESALDISSLMSNLSLYQGELLPGFYDEWIILERERVRAAFEAKIGRLLDRLTVEERWLAVQEWGEKWLAFGNAPELAYRALMLAYAAHGDIAKVAAVYKRCAGYLRDDLGVEPSAETRALYDGLLKGAHATVRVSPTQLSGAATDDLASHCPPLKRTLAATGAPAPGDPPFKGLQYFDEADAEWFFGREELTAELVLRVRASRSISVIIGASGSGKSSLVRAGVVPALKKAMQGNRQNEGAGGLIYVITPTAHPLSALATVFTRDSESVTAPATSIDDLSKDPRSLHMLLRRRQSGSQPLADDGGRTFLIVDQFEELFTLCRDKFEREAFIDNLLYAVSSEQNECLTLIMTLRADFYAHLAQYPELRAEVAKAQEYIGPMTSEELRRAIEEPARRGHWEFEPGLVDLFLRDAGDEPGALPLLSHALLETWRRRSGHTLTLKGYAESGGVRGAIAQTAETLYRSLPPEQQVVARDIFIRLTELGEGTEDTRRRVTLDELVSQGQSADTVRAVLTRLADARLVTTAEGTAEVAHEALIREWPLLREWLTQDREGLRLHRHLSDAAHEWELLQRDSGALYRGARLAQAREWAEANPRELNVQERAFLEASRQQGEAEEAERAAQGQREREAALKLAEVERQRADAVGRRAAERASVVRRSRRRAALLAGALVVAALFGLAALVLAQRAEDERGIASARDLATAAIYNLAGNPERSILLALQAVSVLAAALVVAALLGVAGIVLRQRAFDQRRLRVGHPRDAGVDEQEL